MGHSCCHKKTCPPWAEELIEYLRQVEVFMGTIPDKPNWRDESVKKLASELSSEEIPTFDEHKLNHLSKKIVIKLHEANFSIEEITDFINERIKIEPGPPYCSVEEMQEYLEK